MKDVEPLLKESITKNSLYFLKKITCIENLNKCYNKCL